MEVHLELKLESLRRHLGPEKVALGKLWAEGQRREVEVIHGRFQLVLVVKQYRSSSEKLRKELKALLKS